MKRLYDFLGLVPSNSTIKEFSDALHAAIRVQFVIPDRWEPIVVVPEMAAEWLSRLNYGEQRKLREKALECYSSNMEQGTFLPSLIAFCRVGDSNGLVDGYHRCNVARNDGRSFLAFPLQFEADDEKARADLYSLFNGGLIGRSQDKLTSEILRQAGLKSKNEGVLLQSCCDWVEGKLAKSALADWGSRRPILDQQQFVIKHGASARLYFDAIQGTSGSWMFNRKPVLSVFLPLIYSYPQEIVNLLHRVARNDSLAERSAANKLYQILNVRRVPQDQTTAFMRSIAYCCIKHLDKKNVSRITEQTVVLPGCGWVVGG